MYILIKAVLLDFRQWRFSSECHGAGCSLPEGNKTGLSYAFLR
jgi:hypothetical protein